MGTFFTILLVLLLLVLFFFLGISLFAYKKVKDIWNKTTGQESNSPFGSFTASFNGRTYSTGSSSSSSQSKEESTKSSRATKQPGQRIFAENEGEYVDFEIVDDKTQK